MRSRLINKVGLLFSTCTVRDHPPDLRAKVICVFLSFCFVIFNYFVGKVSSRRRSHKSKSFADELMGIIGTSRGFRRRDLYRIVLISKKPLLYH
jgi:hypothetical protein